LSGENKSALMTNFNMYNDFSMNYRFIGVLCFGLISWGAFGQNRTALQNLTQVLQSEDTLIRRFADPNSPHELQVYWSEVHVSADGLPSFDTATFQADPKTYFYPASTAKLPIAIMALEKIRRLQSEGYPLDEHTLFQVIDPKNNQLIAKQKTVLNLIQEIFLVSDNDAYNYLFDFLGRDQINQRLHEMDITDTRIHHKFLAGADNENTWEYKFFDQGQLVYHQPSIQAKKPIINESIQGLHKGKGFVLGDSLIQQPMDFTYKNHIPLEDLVGMIKRLIWFEEFTENQRWRLNRADADTLLYWMGRNTLESENPRYTEDLGYWDSYNKFLLYGDLKGEMSPKIRIYNKIGQAYGTLTDIAYIKEGDHQGILAVSLLVNENGIFNDDHYEYEELGLPFMGVFGRALWSVYTSGYVD